MAESNDLEIYKQRYETFRHLDSMRYQMQNITILIGTLFAGYAANLNGNFHPILSLIIGAVLLTFAYTMRRISKGIVANSIVLSEFGIKVGDFSLPKASMGWTTATFWTTSATFLIGSLLIIYSALKLCPCS